MTEAMEGTTRAYVFFISVSFRWVEPFWARPASPLDLFFLSPTRVGKGLIALRQAQ